MDTHEWLVAARNWTAEHWAPGVDGCMIAALRRTGPASLGRVIETEPFNELCAAVGITTGLSVWHDAQTKTTVLAAYDKAIAATAPEPADPLAGVTVEAEAVA